MVPMTQIDTGEVVRVVNKTHPSIICCNCGGLGHVYARCNHPITSYGIICYRMMHDPESNTIHPEYLMVQRKDSLSYVEFMRGKYNLQNLSYVMRLFSNMTREERDGIRGGDFDCLWKQLWSSSNGKNFMREYSMSKERYTKLKEGYLMRCAKPSEEVYLVNIEYVLMQTQPGLSETEWGFPKGRRNFSDEDDKRCALREFREETGVNLRNIRLMKDLKPFEEIFTGSNKIRYKHIYYLSKISDNTYDDDSLFNPLNKHQAREIKDVRWFTYNDAQSKIGAHNIERKELLKRLNAVVLKYV